MTDWICIVSLFDITLIDLKSPLSYSMIYVDRFSVGHFNSTIIQTLQDRIGLLHVSMKR
jgi:hypothetical protein